MVVLLAAAVATLVLRRWRRASRSPNRGDDPPKLSAAQRRAVQRAVERLRDEEPG
jgi:hypothetical protein